MDVNYRSTNYELICLLLIFKYGETFFCCGNCSDIFAAVSKLTRVIKCGSVIQEKRKRD